MKKKASLIVMAALLACTLSLVACNGASKEETGNAQSNVEAGAALQGDAQAGYEFAVKSCQMCHSLPTSPNFALHKSEEDIVKLLASHSAMSFSEDDAKDVAAWILSE